MEKNDVPSFDFAIPVGYTWLIDQGLVGFAANTSLQPWHYLPSRHVIDLKSQWPSGPSELRLIAFAKRQDCDDLACFEVRGKEAKRIVLVHGWAETGYTIESTFDSFWEWFKAVIDDIAEWTEVSSD